MTKRKTPAKPAAKVPVKRKRVRAAIPLVPHIPPKPLPIVLRAHAAQGALHVVPKAAPAAMPYGDERLEYLRADSPYLFRGCVVLAAIIVVADGFAFGRYFAGWW